MTTRTDAQNQKADERRKRLNDRRQPDDRRREVRILFETGQPRPDRREGPRRREDGSTID